MEDTCLSAGFKAMHDHIPADQLEFPTSEEGMKASKIFTGKSLPPLLSKYWTCHHLFPRFDSDTTSSQVLSLVPLPKSPVWYYLFQVLSLIPPLPKFWVCYHLFWCHLFPNSESDTTSSHILSLMTTFHVLSLTPPLPMSWVWHHLFPCPESDTTSSHFLSLTLLQWVLNKGPQPFRSDGTSADSEVRCSYSSGSRIWSRGAKNFFPRFCPHSEAKSGKQSKH